MMIDRHHLLFERNNWDATAPGRTLRATPSLIPKLDREVHEQIHRDIPSIPILGHAAMLAIRMRFNPTGDTLRDMDGFALAYDRATKSPRSHQAERDIAGIAIEQFLKQKAYVMEGILRA